MHAVTGKVFESAPAVLAGFRRRRIDREDYPGMVRDAAEVVSGLLAFDVDELSLEALDRFEGEYYERLPVVVNASGNPVSAWTYVIRDEYAHLMTDEPWDLQRFRTHFLQRFMFTYPNF